MEKPLIFEKPLGVKDYLPDEVSWKKEIERRISTCMERWGYREIITPALEYYDTIGGKCNLPQQKLYKLIDRDGKTLVLRPDMTTPIARVVASLLKDEPLPLRLCYNTSIYRMQESNTGKYAEFFQSGIELIGCEQPFADAEVIVLAIESLKAAGLERFKVAIGETTFLESFLCEMAPTYTEALKDLLIKQDFVGWKEYITSLPLEERQRDALLQLPKLQGGKSVIFQAKALTQSPVAIQALQYLEEIWSFLEYYGAEEYVHVDFTTLRGQDYYTGMIFEIYAASVGFPICGGGRYDNLIGEFGRQAPAVGFGIWLERLIEALHVEYPAPKTYLFIYACRVGEQAKQVIEKAKIWRAAGHNVEIIGIGDNMEDVIAQRRESGLYADIWLYEQWGTLEQKASEE